MPDEPTLVGQTLSHYRILEKIGAGGMGEVYLAHDLRLDRDVALKVLHPGTVNGEAARKRFRQEALALSRLNHPNIATAYDFDTHGAMSFLVMEYVSGETLSQKVRAGSLAEKDVVRLGLQLAEGLAAAHEQGVIHRDLKPGNTRLTSDGRLKILDFGLSKLLQVQGETAETATVSLNGPFDLVGTLAYMAPEQFRGQPVDARTDIWSAGVLLYRMATGRLAFSEADTAKMIGSILGSAPTPLRNLNRAVSPGLENIVLKCLEKDPDDRYQSAKELAVDLRRLLSPVRVTPADAERKPHIVAKMYFAGGVLALASVGLILGFNVGGVRDRVFSGKKYADIHSVVVLPLANLSGDSQQEYFADGMTEALISDLSRIRSLRVISRTSSMQYKGTQKTLPKIAQELQVDGVVQGSVLRVGNRVRISAQLINGPHDKTLWAENYERDFTDILALQGEVAHAIANQIQIEVTPQEQARLAAVQPINPEAYQQYLRGRFFLNKGTEEDYRTAYKHFRRAIDVDPNYALALAGLAYYFLTTDELPPKVAMPQAKENVLKALEIDDGLSDAHTTLANVKFNADWDWLGAEQEFQKAIELNPSSAEGHRAYSVFLSAMGRHAEAIAEIKIAQRLDPLSLIADVDVGWAYYFARQYDQAIQHCRETLELDPSFVGAHDCLGSAYLAKADYEHAIAECQKATAGSQNDLLREVGLARAYAGGGKTSEARKVLDRLQAESQHRYVPAYFNATVHAALGERDQAIAQLAKAFQERDPNLAWLKVDNAFDEMRVDVRFQEMLSRIGLPL